MALDCDILTLHSLEVLVSHSQCRILGVSVVWVLCLEVAIVYRLLSSSTTSSACPFNKAGAPDYTSVIHLFHLSDFKVVFPEAVSYTDRFR